MNLNNIYKNNLNVIAKIKQSQYLNIKDSSQVYIKPNYHTNRLNLNYWIRSQEKKDINSDYNLIKYVINTSFFHYLNIVNILNRKKYLTIESRLFTKMDLLNDKENIENILCLLSQTVDGLERYYILNNKLNDTNLNDINRYITLLRWEIENLKTETINLGYNFVNSETPMLDCYDENESSSESDVDSQVFNNDNNMDDSALGNSVNSLESVLLVEENDNEIYNIDEDLTNKYSRYQNNNNSNSNNVFYSIYQRFTYGIALLYLKFINIFY